jgi:superfamily II DNA or RNA helicase
MASYGHVVVDECHHVLAVSFERVMREVKARYVLGLTATPIRRDGHQPIIQLRLGPARYTIGAKKHAASRCFDHLLVPRETEFRMTDDAPGVTIHEVYRQLVQDPARNRLIVRDVVAALREGRSPIVLTERRAHLKYLAEQFQELAPNLIVLHGGMKPKRRHEAIERLKTTPAGEERLALATGRFIGEGFDDARLDTLFLAMPVSWKGTLVQYAGRLHRTHHGKTEVRMVDYVDRHVPMLARMFERRKRGSAGMGYSAGGAEAGLFDGLG